MNRRTLLGLAALGLIPAGGCSRQPIEGPNGVNGVDDLDPVPTVRPVTKGGGYPGDAQMDWVGVSGYADTQTPGDMFDAVYNDYAGRKPIMLTEVAVVNHGGRTKADWIIEFAAWVKTRPGIGAVVWFDTDTHPGSTEKWRIDSPGSALAAYRAMADDPAFGG
jgi:hypothetical protein